MGKDKIESLESEDSHTKAKEHPYAVPPSAACVRARHELLECKQGTGMSQLTYPESCLAAQSQKHRANPSRLSSAILRWDKLWFMRKLV